MTTVSLHRLVLLYLYVAYKADHHFDPRERQAIIELATHWAPDVEPDDVAKVVDAAFEATRSGQEAEVDTLAQEVGLELTPDERYRAYVQVLARERAEAGVARLDLMARASTALTLLPSA